MEILRLRACQWCWQPFVLCRACDRGHVYCSLPCRHASRVRSLRAAGRRHQQSPEGRLDHRDHQRAYRALGVPGATGSTPGVSLPLWLLCPVFSTVSGLYLSLMMIRPILDYRCTANLYPSKPVPL